MYDMIESVKIMIRKWMFIQVISVMFLFSYVRTLEIFVHYSKIGTQLYKRI